MPSATATPGAAAGDGLGATVVQASDEGSYASVRASGLPFVSHPPVTYSVPSAAATPGFSRGAGVSAMRVQASVAGS